MVLSSALVYSTCSPVSVWGYDRGGSMRDLILLPEILPSVAVGDNTKMCLTSLILFVAAQKIIERMGNPLLKIRLARQRREIDPSGLGPKVPRLVLKSDKHIVVLELSKKVSRLVSYPPNFDSIWLYISGIQKNYMMPYHPN
ncbi:hypothetical protein J1N35_006478 [Gossypium stocksii]|uniref:Uncharacterized protein n=1 Tax=Gossypium stocksii TaxID=47602 RepID=A0A9D4AJY9_9ROSI|nr:hypothetical protein J1N35_006478 [Gossypium stocksii]